MLDTKLVPHSPEAEEGVIGSLLIDGGCLNAVSFLKPSDFFSESARKIYQSCLNLKERSESINQITVATELVRLNWLTEIGGECLSIPCNFTSPYFAGC